MTEGSALVDTALLSDEELVDLLPQRDMAALGTLYERHARSTFALALRLLGDREQAEEIVQECFLKLWIRPDTFDPGRGRLVSWLLGVVHHRAVDSLRRRPSGSASSHRQRRDRRSRPEHRRGPDGTHLGASTERRGRSCPGETATRTAAGRRARVLPGLTQTEIAEHLKQPLGTVKIEFASRCRSFELG